MKSAFLAIILLEMASMFGEGQTVCKTAAELDDCVYKSAFLINRNIAIPTTVDELRGQYCVAARESLGCVTNFSEKCVTGPPKLLLKKIYGTVKRGLDERCDNENKASEFVENVKCLNTEEKIEAVRMCSDKHIKLLEKVVELEFGQRTGPLCCSFQAFKQCTTDAVKDGCGEDQATYFQTILNEYSDELVSLTCTQFDSLDKCAANLKPDIWSTMHPIIESTEKIEHNYKTAVPIMYKMIEKFIKSK